MNIFICQEPTCGKSFSAPESKRMYCSRSCSARQNNKKHPKRKNTHGEKTCPNCSKTSPRKFFHQNFCNAKCRFEHLFKTVTISNFNNGRLRTALTLKKCMTLAFGYVCIICGNTGTHCGKSLTLELDHIDGNSDNNLPSNLRFLCPNCHTQTPTYKYKNKNAGSRAKKRYKK